MISSRPRGIVGKASGVDVHRWLCLVATIWLQSVNGTNSNFPAYSSQLKQAMSISQLQLNNLAFANDAGKLFGWISGIAALYLPLWSVLLLGSILGLISYGIQYLFLSGHLPISGLSYPAIFILTILAGNSICWINTVCFAVIIANFSSECRQVAVGISTSYQGLSANIYTDIVDVMVSKRELKSLASTPSLMPPNMAGKRANNYLLLNSIMPPIVSMLTSFFVRGDKAGSCPEDGDEDGVSGLFVVLFALTIATGVYAVVSSLGVNSTNISLEYIVVGMGLLLVAPLIIPAIDGARQTRLGRWWVNRHNEMQIHNLPLSVTEAVDRYRPTISETGVNVAQEGGQVLIKRMQQFNIEAAAEPGSTNHNNNTGLIREEIGVKLMLSSIDFWLYFFTYLFGATIGLVYLNNLGQITESRGSSTTSIVSLSSAFSFFGRLLPSLLEYVLCRQKRMVSRQACVVGLMIPMTASFFLLLDPRNLFLCISTAIISLSTGAITSISVSITTELFGTKNFSVNHNVVVGNIPIGSFLFGLMAAILYRQEGNADGKCIGVSCYRDTFIIWGCLCFLGTALSLMLYARTSRFSSRVLAGRS